MFIIVPNFHIISIFLYQKRSACLSIEILNYESFFCIFLVYFSVLVYSVGEAIDFLFLIFIVYIYLIDKCRQFNILLYTYKLILMTSF